MKTFIKIKVGYIVFDNVQSVSGTVKSVNYESNTAEVEVSPENTVISKLTNLTVFNNKDKGDSNLEIKVKYFNPKLTKIAKISQGDWIDLRAAETVVLKAGESRLIPLGVAMKLPENYEAPVIPRSSTYKNFGVLQTNSFGLIDNSYSGNDDQWLFPAYATRDTVINFDDRICQFRIQKRMPKVTFTEVDTLDDVNRGGFGSTGTK